MRIIKHWEVTCDVCGTSDYYSGRKPDVAFLLRKKYKYYEKKLICGEKCLEKYKENPQKYPWYKN